MTRATSRRGRIALATALVFCAGLAGGCTGGTGITLSSGGVSGLPATSRAVRVESGVEPGPQAGRRTISGYVYNDYGRALGNVRLVVEPLDTAGQSTDRRIFQVHGTVPPFGRAYFSFTAAEAAGYRVGLHSFEMEPGGV
jgi:hypothetical protein